MTIAAAMCCAVHSGSMVLDRPSMDVVSMARREYGPENDWLLGALEVLRWRARCLLGLDMWLLLFPTPTLQLVSI